MATRQLNGESIEILEQIAREDTDKEVRKCAQERMIALAATARNLLDGWNKDIRPTDMIAAASVLGTVGNTSDSELLARWLDHLILNIYAGKALVATASDSVSQGVANVAAGRLDARISCAKAFIAALGRVGGETGSSLLQAIRDRRAIAVHPPTLGMSLETGYSEYVMLMSRYTDAPRRTVVKSIVADLTDGKGNDKYAEARLCQAASEAIERGESRSGAAGEQKVSGTVSGKGS